MLTFLMIAALGGLLAGFALGGWTVQRSEAAFRARMITRGVAAGLAEHGIDRDQAAALAARVVRVDQAPGAFEIDDRSPARVTVANYPH